MVTITGTRRPCPATSADSTFGCPACGGLHCGPLPDDSLNRAGKLVQEPSLPFRTTQDGDGNVAVTEDAMDVEKTTNNSEDTGTMASSTGDKKTPLSTSELEEGNGIKAKPYYPTETDEICTSEDGSADNIDVDLLACESSDCVPLTRRPWYPRLWGRDASEKFMHTVPESHGGPDKKRIIFRTWSRRPDGKPIGDLLRAGGPNGPGKVSPDGFPWGATLYDFYNVNTVPGDQSAMSHMTGSALLQVMKALGEYDPTAQEIEWALSEGMSKDEGTAKAVWLVRIADTAVHRTVFGERTVPDSREIDEANMAAEGGTKIASYDVHVDPVSIPPSGPPEVPVSSPFHSSHYPKPWPFVPFEMPVLLPLQERIPSYLLPRTLYVHDPFNLLSARDRSFRNTSWNSLPDDVRTYNIKYSEAAHKDSEEKGKKAEELEELKACTRIVLRYARTEDQIKNDEPVIEVALPPRPRRTTRVEESHLYLSPVAKAGSGHHSIVYRAEWELPRDLFVKPEICDECFEESVDKEIERLKNTGRWEKLLDSKTSPTGFAGCQPTQAGAVETNDPTGLEKDEGSIEREVTLIVSPSRPGPSCHLETLDKTIFWDAFMEMKGIKTTPLDFTSESEDAPKQTEDSHISIIRIIPPFSYERSQTTCKHPPWRYTPLGPVPRTAKFSVIAKLSLKNDKHLAREAQNYQQFPEHFFQNYSGYTLIDQLHTVVPVHAIVPQFYGYYTPQEDGSKQSYLSPILLLEHCGEPISPDTLSLEDQEECVSMLLRLHRAGWLHESVHPRNFLVQEGMPMECPVYRILCNPEPSFRLIDFGRSRKFDEASEKWREEKEALRTFVKLRGKMSLTKPYERHGI